MTSRWRGMPIIGDLPLFLAYRGHLPGQLRFFNSQAGQLRRERSYLHGRVVLLVQWRPTDGRPSRCNTGYAGLPVQLCRRLASKRTAQSDRRLKTDVAELGTTADGLKLYSWKYTSDPVTTWVGVMAQDLEETRPEALVVGADGYYRVRYDDTWRSDDDARTVGSQTPVSERQSSLIT
jgi:hypothetical protein